jgi:hypothetical protein
MSTSRSTFWRDCEHSNAYIRTEPSSHIIIIPTKSSLLHKHKHKNYISLALSYFAMPATMNTMLASCLLASTALVSTTALVTPPHEQAVSPPWPVNDIECGPNQLYVIDKRGQAKTRPVPSMFYTTTGCVDKPVSLLQVAEDETPVDLNDDTMRVEHHEDLGGNYPERPGQFTELWDNALSGCNSNQCSDVEVRVQKSIQAPLPDSREVVMRINGNFPSGDVSQQRDHFFELLREAFDRAVELGDMTGGVYEIGPAYLYARAGQNTQYAASWLSVEFSDDEADRGCSDVIDTINSFGALVPHLGTFFGVASAVCAQLG